jgi:DNA-binding transcriptional LysR family regulator
MYASCLQVFQRLGKRVLLTEAGQIVQHYAEQVLALGAETQRALRELHGLHRGTLRLGASSTSGIYLLPPVLAAFVARYPGIILALQEQTPESLRCENWPLTFVWG